MENLKKLISYLQGANKYIHLDDKQGWGKGSTVDGYIPAIKNGGVGLRAVATGNTFTNQGATIRRGNHLDVQLRSVSPTGEVKVDEHIKIGDLFPQQDIVVVTKGNVIQFFAPVIKKRSDMFKYIALLQSHLAERRAKGKKTFWNFEGDMIDLSLYLYQNNPEKEEDQFCDASVCR